MDKNSCTKAHCKHFFFNIDKTMMNFKMHECMHSHYSIYNLLFNNDNIIKHDISTKMYIFTIIACLKKI